MILIEKENKMKKALIFCLTALFAQQAMASDSWSYIPWSYLSGAGNWIKEHKALTGLGLAGAYALYRYSQSVKRQQQADNLIDEMNAFLPTADANPPYDRNESEDLLNETKKFASNLAWIEVDRHGIRTPHIYGPFFDITVLGEQYFNNAPQLIATARELGNYTSPNKITDFQIKLLNDLENLPVEQNQKINLWLNALNTKTHDRRPYPLPEYNTLPDDNNDPINCNAQTCRGIINQMREALKLPSGKNIKRARR